MRSSMIVLAVLSLSVACSKVEKAEKNMKSMTDTTNHLSSDMEEMKGTTTTMYQQVRAKEAEDTRNQKFEILNSKDEKFGAKIAAAAVYYQSFEFQLWTGQKSVENLHTREVLFLDAVNEFTRRICDIYNQINVRRMSPTKESKSQSAEQSFYALAATMHLTHHYQNEMVLASKGKNISGVSFYDLVKNALRKDEYGERLKNYEAVLVAGLNKEIMIELLQARVDMLSALALKDLTDKRGMSVGQKTKGLIFKITGGLLGSIDLPETYLQSNQATKESSITYLEGALKTKKVLEDIGVKKKLEKVLRSAFSKIDLNQQGEALQEENKMDLDTRTKTQNLIEALLN